MSETVQEATTTQETNEQPAALYTPTEDELCTPPPTENGQPAKADEKPAKADEQPVKPSKCVTLLMEVWRPLLFTLLMGGVCVALVVLGPLYIKHLVIFEELQKYSPGLTAVVWVTVYVLAVPFPLPIKTLMSLLAGYLFGFWLGVLAVYASSFVGCILGYWLARACLGTSFQLTWLICQTNFNHVDGVWLLLLDSAVTIRNSTSIPRRGSSC